MRAALDLLRAGTVDPVSLVSHRLALEETGRAFELARSARRSRRSSFRRAEPGTHGKMPGSRCAD